MIDKFIEYLKSQNMSDNTIKSYKYDLKSFINWFESEHHKKLSKLFSQNILQYKLYLEEVGLNAKTINHKLSSIKKLNEYLIKEGIQKNLVINDSDLIAIQLEYASPTKVTEQEVNKFMQEVLEGENTRNNAIVVMLRYTGLRISEALNIKTSDYNLVKADCIIRGKGNKQRVIIFNKKVIIALKEYLKKRDSYKFAKSSEYLFISNKAERIDRTRVNKVFNKYSEKITPHQLRHYFATQAIESGEFTIHEIAYLLGHSNIHTTLLYTNPNRDKIKHKLDKL